MDRRFDFTGFEVNVMATPDDAAEVLGEVTLTVRGAPSSLFNFQGYISAREARALATALFAAAEEADHLASAV